jgi:hypothetical protein
VAITWTFRVRERGQVGAEVGQQDVGDLVGGVKRHAGGDVEVGLPGRLADPGAAVDSRLEALSGRP